MASRGRLDPFMISPDCGGNWALGDKTAIHDGINKRLGVLSINRSSRCSYWSAEALFDGDGGNNVPTEERQAIL